MHLYRQPLEPPPPSTLQTMCFYNGESPGACGPHRGKQMTVTHPDVDRLYPRLTHEKIVSEEAAKMSQLRPSFDRMGESDAPHRGKRMYGEGAHKANAYLFVEYGSFPPPKPRPYGAMRDNSPDKLAPLMHHGHEDAKKHDVDKIASTPSLFQKNLERGALHGFYKIREPNPNDRLLSVARAQRGLLDAVVGKGDDGNRTGKKMVHRGEEMGVLTRNDPSPIPGLAGVGVGQAQRFDKIQSHDRKDTMPPMQPHFGTKHDAVYGVHGFTTCPPAPPEDEREGWFNWTEDRQKCPVTDAGFDPLLLKEHYCSPGDPLNHPQRLKKIDQGTPQVAHLLHAELEKVEKEKLHCVKMFPRVGSPDELVAGFRGLGDLAREAAVDRPRGMRHIEPVHWQSRRARSSME